MALRLSPLLPSAPAPARGLRAVPRLRVRTQAIRARSRAEDAPSFLDQLKEATPVVTVTGALAGVITTISVVSNAGVAAKVEVLSSQLAELKSTSQSQLAELKSTSQSQFSQLSSKLDNAVRLSGSVERIDKDLTALLSKK